MAFAHIGVVNVEKRIPLQFGFPHSSVSSFQFHPFLHVGFEGSAVSGSGCWLVAAVRSHR